MKAQRSQFDFPNVYGLGTTANFNYVVMENIVNFNTGHQSENYASLISKSDNRKSQELLTELIIFLSSGKTAGLTIASDSHSQILQQRLRRVVAFCSVKKPITEKITRRDAHFRKNVEEISRLLQKTFNYDTKRVSHGDATLSNFLRQETAESFRIRAIDPNPRVPIGRLEFDFGKIMQSIDSMYEDTLLNPDLVDLGLEGYLERYSVNSNTEFLINAIQKNNPNIDMGLLHLFHLTHLIRILPYQQKNGAKHVHYWQDIINYKFEEHFK
jgi:hypothetical protein